MPRLNSIRELDHLREYVRQQRRDITTTIMVGGGTCCQASGSQDVVDAIKAEISRQGLEQTVRLCVTGCHGFCEQDPVIVIEPGNIVYCQVSSEDAFEIVQKTVMRSEIIEHLLYTDPVSGEKCPTEADIPFYQMQDRHWKAYR